MCVKSIATPYHIQKEMREAGGDSTKELIRKAEELLHQLRPIETAESANTSMPRTQAPAVSQSGKGKIHIQLNI